MIRTRRVVVLGALLAAAVAAPVACGSSPVDPGGSAATTSATTASGGAAAGTTTSSTSSSSGGPGGAGGGATTSSGGAGGAALVDDDGDGLDDAWEAKIAADYLPFLSIDPDDGCPLGGIVYRVRPHPADPSLIQITYDHLYQNDCGLGGHVGDDEAFGVTVDPAQPPPEGIVAIRAIGHQGTFCEQVSECGRCPGEKACDTTLVAGVAWPVVFASKDKHGSYAYADKCNPITACFDVCSLAPTRPTLPMVNAGEPGHPLITDLTTHGFITAANGWTEASLMNFDPWDTTKDFGGAGNIAGDLADDAFVPPACP